MRCASIKATIIWQEREQQTGKCETVENNLSVGGTTTAKGACAAFAAQALPKWECSIGLGGMHMDMDTDVDMYTDMGMDMVKWCKRVLCDTSVFS